MPTSEVRHVMNYKLEAYMSDISEDMIRCFPKMAPSFYIIFVEMGLVAESFDRWMFEQKEHFTRQLKANSVVTREIEVDKDYDKEKTTSC